MAEDETKTRASDERSPSTGGRALAFWEQGHAACPLSAPGQLLIGRGEGSDLRIEHDTVSRKHARLHFDGQLTVVDLGSSNGTRVGGQRLIAGEPRVVQPGELVEVGDAYLVLELPDPATPSGGRLDDMTDRVARSELSVLLLGETGVGKEVAAERIHRLSPRSAGPLLKVNCATLGGTLLESELFGHERGAFTGAVATKLGLLEAARGGTVFLDEVAELDSSVQAKLLRALEYREIRRVGGVQSRSIDVRFIAATNRPLDQLVATGAFRRDLYFRLAGITLRLPPLRQRLVELAALSETLLAAACERQGRAPVRLSNRALARLRQHPFPGNVRELKNVLERALVMTDGERIEPEHLLFDSPGDAPLTSAASERDRIAEALEAAGGNQTRAAELLGISRRTLVNRLDQFGFPRPRKR
jgi:DNA-binding NtrC family response regulator